MAHAGHAATASLSVGEADASTRFRGPIPHREDVEFLGRKPETEGNSYPPGRGGVQATGPLSCEVNAPTGGRGNRRRVRGTRRSHAIRRFRMWDEPGAIGNSAPWTTPAAPTARRSSSGCSAASKRRSKRLPAQGSLVR